jgi:hypothetical protein
MMSQCFTTRVDQLWTVLHITTLPLDLISYPYGIWLYQCCIDREPAYYLTDMQAHSASMYFLAKWLASSWIDQV